MADQPSLPSLPSSPPYPHLEMSEQTRTPGAYPKDNVPLQKRRWKAKAAAILSDIISEDDTFEENPHWNPQGDNFDINHWFKAMMEVYSDDEGEDLITQIWVNASHITEYKPLGMFFEQHVARKGQRVVFYNFSIFLRDRGVYCPILPRGQYTSEAILIPFREISWPSDEERIEYYPPEGRRRGWRVRHCLCQASDFPRVIVFIPMLVSNI